MERKQNPDEFYWETNFNDVVSDTSENCIDTGNLADYNQCEKKCFFFFHFYSCELTGRKETLEL